MTLDDKDAELALSIYKQATQKDDLPKKTRYLIYSCSFILKRISLNSASQ